MIFHIPLTKSKNEYNFKKNCQYNIGGKNMKKNIFITFLLFFVVLISGCTNLENNNQTPGNTTYKITEKDSKTNHYEDNEISFDYPSNWNITVRKYSISLFNDRSQVTIEKPGINAAYILENISRKNVSATVPLPSEVISNKTITVDGLKAQKITYQTKGDSGPSRIEITINKNSKLFRIYFYAPADEFKSAEVDFNMIINSFKIK